MTELSWAKVLAILVLAFAMAYAALTLGPLNGASAGGQCNAIPEVVGSELEGTPCDDILVATAGIVEIVGGGGNDQIISGYDVDEISAGAGNDVVIGTPGSEEIDSGTGDDVIFADTPPQQSAVLQVPQALRGSVRHAIKINRRARSMSRYDAPINGNEYPNSLEGGSGNDRINCNGGDDLAWGERGNDRIFGAEGDDRLYAGVGDDLVSGGNGNDLLAGGNGNDNLVGNDGNDLVRGDTVGDDRHTVPQANFGDPNFPDGLNGGPGNDTLSFAAAVSPGFADTDIPTYADPKPIAPSSVSGFPLTSDLSQRGVYVDLYESYALNGKPRDGGGTDLIADDFENVIGSPYADYIRGNNSTNKLFGGGGTDIILGLHGDDFIFGGGDSDHILAGDEIGDDDTVYGGSTSATFGSSNYCKDAESEYDCSDSSPGVVARSSDKIGVGLVQTNLTSSGPRFTELYIYGSQNGETVKLVKDSGGVTITSTGALFDTSQHEGCSYPVSGQATCAIASSDNLDVIHFDGGDNDDTFNAYDTTLNANITPVILGGNGSDTLMGSDQSEDIIIDGPDGGNDKSWGYGRTDVLYQGGGSDELYGGDVEGDVLYSTGICQGNKLNGGAELAVGDDFDNITWAALSLPNKSMTNGVHANLNPAWSFAGNMNAYGATGCTGGATPDTLTDIENLEGSNGRDYLFGNDEPNTLIGRAGVDYVWGYGGEDDLHTYSDDFDAYVNCGTFPSGHPDTWRKDEDRGGRDATSASCESADTVDEKPEYDYAIDKTVIGNSKSDPNTGTPKVFYRLGERSGSTAYASDDVGQPAPGAYANNVVKEQTGPFPDSEDTAVSLNGTNAYVDLGNLTDGNGGYDPGGNNPGGTPYATSGYSFEIWVKFDTVAAGGTDYDVIMSKFAGDGSRGIYFYRNPSGKIVFGTKSGSGGHLRATSTSTANTIGKWYQVVGTLLGNEMKLYVDGSMNSATGSVFPSATTAKNLLLGKIEVQSSANWTGGAGWLDGYVDSAAVYARALSSCQVNRHFDLATAGLNPRDCP